MLDSTTLDYAEDGLPACYWSNPFVYNRSLDCAEDGLPVRCYYLEPLPNTELLTLNYAEDGLPFCVIPLTHNICLRSMNFAEDGLPFVTLDDQLPEPLPVSPSSPVPVEITVTEELDYAEDGLPAVYKALRPSTRPATMNYADDGLPACFFYKIQNEEWYIDPDRIKSMDFAEDALPAVLVGAKRSLPSRSMDFAEDGLPAVTNDYFLDFKAKYWDGGEWVAGVLKRWNGAEWEEMIIKINEGGFWIY